MGYAAIALAILGFATGIFFRLRVLLVVIAALLLLSITYAFSAGLSFSNSLMMIMAAQTLVQGSYFLGLVAHAVFTSHNGRPIL